eukprot:CAMPEP_0117433746 /NCGR_PEP_ID=MMETSP0758-20121206/13041_1 /TAXON_ID=63605 /ORGANISM="Percolomonas cosmopolitus, Strain AE-1 (ATCC 50343)" /LENGTH=304 /DNA_ID=CAMNT_0005224585 /DNA_START=479 /DNA_END=1389 /DNA_ORIENTATION=+
MPHNQKYPSIQHQSTVPENLKLYASSEYDLPAIQARSSSPPKQRHVSKYGGAANYHKLKWATVPKWNFPPRMSGASLLNIQNRYLVLLESHHDMYLFKDNRWYVMKNQLSIIRGQSVIYHPGLKSIILYGGMQDTETVDLIKQQEQDYNQQNEIVQKLELERQDLLASMETIDAEINGIHDKIKEYQHQLSSGDAIQKRLQTEQKHLKSELDHLVKQNKNAINLFDTKSRQRLKDYTAAKEELEATIASSKSEMKALEETFKKSTGNQVDQITQRIQGGSEPEEGVLKPLDGEATEPKTPHSSR